MSRCNCDVGACTCSITGESGIKITGNGGPGTPFVITIDTGGCSKIAFSVDEANNTLKATVTYCDGVTVKTGLVALA